MTFFRKENSLKKFFGQTGRCPPKLDRPGMPMDLSREGVYDPDAVDNLVSWLESYWRQDTIVNQLAEQVGSIHHGQYIIPKHLFPHYTLPGESWH